MNHEGNETQRNETPGEVGATSGSPMTGIVVSNAVAPAAFRDQALESFTFNFTPPTIFSGDCSLGADTLEVFSDGHCEWRANSVMSSDPGDDSFCMTFEFFDSHGISLWRFGRICSPTLFPTPLVWVSNNQLFFPSYIFPSIAQATATPHC